MNAPQLTTPSSPSTITTVAPDGLSFTQVDSRIHVANAIIEFEDDYGSTRKAKVAFRLDGRGGDYRVDAYTFPGAPWEAIDDGVGFAVLAEAAEHASAWRRACTAQSTLTPRMPSRR